MSNDKKSGSIVPRGNDEMNGGCVFRYGNDRFSDNNLSPLVGSARAYFSYSELNSLKTITPSSGVPWRCSLAYFSTNCLLPLMT